MAGKLPRRTMSMAKRATQTAEAAADLDVVEQLTGDPLDEPVGALAYIGAWIAAVVGLVVIIMAAGFACNLSTVGVDWSPGGALPNDASPTSEPFYRQGDPTDGRMGTGKASPFPDAEQEEPIILEVVCPPGTVHVSTGENAADSLCVVGKLAGTAPEPTTQATVQPTPTVQQSTIGATLVPLDLDCEEDEVITFTPVDPIPPDGYPLGCVHIDTLE